MSITASISVSPAYGRSYKNAREALAAWHEGKDFILHSLFESGYCSIRSFEKAKGTLVEIRFGKHLQKIATTTIK